VTAAYDPPWHVLDDVATAYDTSDGSTRYICVTAIADPLDQHIRVGDLRFTPHDARAFGIALLIAAAAATDEVLD
jgi:hypothetical protein